jgi:hypothetical protein
MAGIFGEEGEGLLLPSAEALHAGATTPQIVPAARGAPRFTAFPAPPLPVAPNSRVAADWEEAPMPDSSGCGGSGGLCGRGRGGVAVCRGRLIPCSITLLAAD